MEKSKQQQSVDGLWPPYQEINLTETAFKVLSEWASVSRTLKESMRLLEAYSISLPKDSNERESVNYNLSELDDLVRPLDDCNAACKRMKFYLNLQKRKIT